MPPKIDEKYVFSDSGYWRFMSYSQNTHVLKLATLISINVFAIQYVYNHLTNHYFSLSDYAAVVGRKKSARWVKSNEYEGHDYDDDDYEW